MNSSEFGALIARFYTATNRGETTETDLLLVDTHLDRAERLQDHKVKAVRYTPSEIADLRREATRLAGRLRWRRILQALNEDYAIWSVANFDSASPLTIPIRFLLANIGVHGDAGLALVSECDFQDIIKAVGLLSGDDYTELMTLIERDPGDLNSQNAIVTRWKQSLQDTGPRAVFKSLVTSAPITIRQQQTDSRALYRQILKDDKDLPVQLNASRCSIEQGLSIKALEQQVSGDPTAGILSVYNPIPKTTIGVQLLINGKLIERVNVPTNAEREITLGMLNRGTWQVNITDVKDDGN